MSITITGQEIFHVIVVTAVVMIVAGIVLEVGRFLYRLSQEQTNDR